MRTVLLLVIIQSFAIFVGVGFYEHVHPIAGIGMLIIFLDIARDAHKILFRKKGKMDDTNR